MVAVTDRSEVELEPGPDISRAVDDISADLSKKEVGFEQSVPPGRLGLGCGRLLDGGGRGSSGCETILERETGPEHSRAMRTGRTNGRALKT